MTLDANTTQIFIAIIGLFSLIVSGYVGIKQLQINKGQATIVAAQGALHVAVATVDKKTTEAKEELTTVKDHINGMQTLLLKSKDETKTAEVEAAGLAGEAKGREQGIASAVVETVKGGNGKVAALEKEVKAINDKLIEAPAAAPALDLAALAKMLAAELKKDQK